mmetsp:Transcript_22666/g.56742  ORF Transcript_22666/g.56742 Transcript_22666/m.56742 type:complete len:403 (-) Transcript_22666:142-1350(-)
MAQFSSEKDRITSLPSLPCSAHRSSSRPPCIVRGLPSKTTLRRHALCWKALASTKHAWGPMRFSPRWSLSTTQSCSAVAREAMHRDSPMAFHDRLSSLSERFMASPSQKCTAASPRSSFQLTSRSTSVSVSPSMCLKLRPAALPAVFLHRERRARHADDAATSAMAATPLSPRALLSATSASRGTSGAHSRSTRALAPASPSRHSEMSRERRGTPHSTTPSTSMAAPSARIRFFSTTRCCSRGTSHRSRSRIRGTRLWSLPVRSTPRSTWMKALRLAGLQLSPLRLSESAVLLKTNLSRALDPAVGTLSITHMLWKASMSASLASHTARCPIIHERSAWALPLKRICCIAFHTWPILPRALLCIVSANSATSPPSALSASRCRWNSSSPFHRVTSGLVLFWK